MLERLQTDDNVFDRFAAAAIGCELAGPLRAADAGVEPEVESRLADGVVALPVTGPAGDRVERSRGEPSSTAR